MSVLIQLTGSVQLGVIIVVWAASGCIFGLVMSGITSSWVSNKLGSFRFYDITAKVTLFISLVGYILMGVCA